MNIYYFLVVLFVAGTSPIDIMDQLLLNPLQLTKSKKRRWRIIFSKTM